MKRIPFGTSGQDVSAIALGCMRIAALTPAQADMLVRTSLDEGVDFFDHADIYGGGRCEEVFGDVLVRTPSLRGRLWIQSKVGIRKGFFDFSKEHILEAVDGILKRLRTDHLDSLLLHRPDALVEPEEVAEAFTALEKSGKVRFFGVSNQNPAQIELLAKHVPQRIQANQLQLGPAYSPMIDAGMHVNMTDAASVDHGGGILDYCRLKGITIQPWSPFQYGFFKGVFLGSPEYPELNREVDALAKSRRVPPSAIAIAWLLRHPACFQPIVGTSDPAHLRDLCAAAKVELSRPEWYAIWRAAGNTLP
jgi:predicted oxidoreductase